MDMVTLSEQELSRLAVDLEERGGSWLEQYDGSIILYNSKGLTAAVAFKRPDGAYDLIYRNGSKSLSEGAN